MRVISSVIVGVICALLLTSCGLLPRGVVLDSSDQAADARMSEIAKALDEQDAPALKSMFSTFALSGANDIDAGLEYLLSFFPESGVTWENLGVDLSGHTAGDKRSTVLLANYKVSSGGKDYFLFFADFTANDLVNPDNVGLYGLGVTPWTNDRRDTALIQFSDWKASIRLETNIAAGYPGIYVPNDEYVTSGEMVDELMEQVADAVNNQDPAAVAALFSSRALREQPDLQNGAITLLGYLSAGDLEWNRSVVNTVADDTGEAVKLLTAEYIVSVGEDDYWFFLADYSIDAKNPDNVGLAALGLAPFVSGEDPARDATFDDLTSSWIGDRSGPYGIYVPAN